MSDPLERLRHHVSGAIARGEKEAITEQRVERDQRYDIVKCSACGRTWQKIDFGCTLHYYGCTSVETAVQLPVL